MKLVSLFLLLLLAADAVAEEVSVQIEPVAFVASVPASLARELCSGFQSCGGESLSIDEPAIGRDYERTLVFHFGEQHYPGLQSEELAATLSAFLRHRGLLVIDDGSRLPDYIVRGALTGISTNINSGYRSFGGSSLLGIFSPGDKKREVGSVQMSFGVINRRTGRYLTALRTGGTFSQEWISRTFFGGQQSKPAGLSRGLIHSATELALNDAAKRIAQSLGEGQ